MPTVLQLRAARLAELLWNQRGDAPLAATTGTASDTATSSTPAPAASANETGAPGGGDAAAANGGSGAGGPARFVSHIFSRRTAASGTTGTTERSRPTAHKARVQLGRDILKDYETVSIGQSAYFTGVSPPPSPSFSHSTQMKRTRNCIMHVKYCGLVGNTRTTASRTRPGCVPAAPAGCHSMQACICMEGMRWFTV